MFFASFSIFSCLVKCWRLFYFFPVENVDTASPHSASLQSYGESTTPRSHQFDPHPHPDDWRQDANAFAVGMTPPPTLVDFVYFYCLVACEVPRKKCRQIHCKVLFFSSAKTLMLVLRLATPQRLIVFSIFMVA